MPADAASSSPSVSGLQRRIEELGGELRARAAEHEEALQREAAMAEVLQVIKTSPGELEPVFHTILSNAIRLCSAEFGNLFLYKDDRFHVAVLHGAPPAYEEAWQREPAMSVRDHPHVPLARLAATRQVVHIHDVAAERAPLERDARYVSLLEAAGARTMLLVPLLRDEQLIGAIVIYGREARPFSDKQIALLENFAAQAGIAMENARLLDEVQAHSRELTEALAYRTATSEVLNVISRSPTDTQPVFDAIAESTARVCQAESCTVFRFDGELIHYMASCGQSPEGSEAVRRAYPMAPGRGSCAARAILSGAVEQIPDVLADPDHTHGGVADVMKVRSVVAVPMLREGRPIGAIVLLRAAVGPFPQRQIELLQTFADQAVIAVNNVRLFDEVQAHARDLQESLEYQTATSDVMQIISRSTFDLQPVLQRLADTGLRLCEADMCFVFQREGELYRAAAVAAATRDVTTQARSYLRYLEQHPHPPGRGSLTGRVALEGKTVQIADVTADPEYTLTEATTLGKIRTQLGVPLLREGALIGVIILSRQRVEPFTERQIGLAGTFADQAVIAIENTRLLTEQREALERQTATAEVLQVINSSPGNLAPVFDAILEKAHRLCGVAYGSLQLYDGGRFRAVAVHGLAGAFADLLRQGYSPGPNHPSQRLLAGARFAHIPDMAAIDDPLSRASFELSGIRTVLFSPLRKDGALLGQIAAARQEVRPFTEKEIALLESFAAQAAIAMENARLITETRQSLERQTATAEVLQVINSSPGELAPVFDAMLDKATRLSEAAFGILWTYDGERFQAVAFHDVPPAYVEFLQEPQLASPVAPLGRVARGEAFAHVPDLAADEYQERAGFLVRQGLSLGGFRTVLCVPMRKDASLLGAITIYRREVQPFSDKQIALLQNFAAQAVIAMENARLLTEQREALERQTATAEVLQVINSSPGDLTPVFETILEKAHALCGVAYGSLQLYDGAKFRAVAVHSLPEPLARRLREGYAPGLNHPVRRLLAGEDYIHVRDMAEIDDPIARVTVEEGRIRTLLSVALRKDSKLLGRITAARKEVRPFTDKEIALLRSFAEQAVIAMENARLLTEQREALEQQTATAEVLEVINSSPGDLAPVFEAMLEKAMTLCGVAFGFLTIYDGKQFTPVAMRGVPPALAEYFAAGMDQPRPGDAHFRILEGEDIVHNLDQMDEEAYRSGSPLRRAVVDLGGARSALVIALRKEGTVLGALTVYRKEVRPFSDKEIALMQNFAAQAVIAMENARLINETREALEQQRATAEVLRVINSSPGDLMPVFDSMLEKAMHLCGAAFGILWTYDGEWIRAAAVRGATAAYAQFLTSAPHRPGLDNAHGRLLRGERFVHIADAGADAAYWSDDPLRRATVELGGARTILAVPLRQDDVFLGDIVIYRRDVQPFSEKQIALLENFAAQAVIAMENARLLTEQREALEQQTATAEVLEVINASPGNLTPVFDAMLERAVRLSESAFGMMNLYEDNRFKGVALRGVPPEILSFEATPQPGPHNALTRLVNGEDVVHLEDLKAYRSYIEGDPRSRNLVDVCGARSLLAVALRKDDKLVGTLTAYRQEVRPFTDKQIALLESFAAQAVIAIDNARLLDELRQRQAELRVTFDNMGDGVAMFDADLRLAAWNRNFQEIIRLSDADLAPRPTYAEYLRLLADRGEFGAENVEAALATRLQDTDKELRLERTRPDGTVIEARRNAVPGGGFVLIYSDITERKRSEEQIKAARDMAETALAELKTAQSSLIHAEKMASLGQLTAGIAHEIKNPLNFVNNFAGLSVELLDELKEAMAPVRETLRDERRTEIDEALELLNTNLDKIASHGKRADGIVKSMLLHSRGGSGDRQSVDINAVLEEALNLAYHGARAQDQSFNVTLERELQADMAPIEIVPQDVTRVFLNLVGNGFYAVSRRARQGDASFRPTLRVRTRELGEAVEIAIRDNGIGIAPAHRERLFQPFFTTKPTGEGTGLGLSISYDIVTQQHGGTITVDSELGRFTEFTIRLPRVGPAAAGRRPA
jgi:GAF domain-containing protein